MIAWLLRRWAAFRHLEPQGALQLWERAWGPVGAAPSRVSRASWSRRREAPPGCWRRRFRAALEIPGGHRWPLRCATGRGRWGGLSAPCGGAGLLWGDDKLAPLRLLFATTEPRRIRRSLTCEDVGQLASHSHGTSRGTSRSTARSQHRRAEAPRLGWKYRTAGPWARCGSPTLQQEGDRRRRSAVTGGTS